MRPLQLAEGRPDCVVIKRTGLNGEVFGKRPIITTHRMAAIFTNGKRKYSAVVLEYDVAEFKVGGTTDCTFF